MSKPRDERQNDLFRPALDQIINLEHPLVRLAGKIDWGFLDRHFSPRRAERERASRQTGRHERVLVRFASAIVRAVGFCWRDVANRLQQSTVVEPVHPGQRRELDGLEAPPGAAPMNDLGLVEAVDRFGERVVVAVANAADGWLDTRFGEALGVSNADILRPPAGLALKVRAVREWTKGKRRGVSPVLDPATLPADEKGHLDDELLPALYRDAVALATVKPETADAAFFKAFDEWTEAKARFYAMLGEQKLAA